MDLEDQILAALRRIIRATDQHSRQLMQRHGLTGPQLVVLRRLAGEGECPVGELAERVSLAQPTVTDIVARLERRGLVERRRSDRDRRRVLVHATPAGLETLLQAPPPLHERFVERLTSLEDWERNLLLSSLQRIVHMMEAHDLDASPLLVSGPIGPDADEDRAAGPGGGTA